MLYSLTKSQKSQLRGELKHLFIKAEYQRRGFGSVLFKRAVEKAYTHHYTNITWVSDPDAHAFYHKLGAQVIGSQQNMCNPHLPLSVFMYILKNE